MDFFYSQLEKRACVYLKNDKTKFYIAGNMNRQDGILVGNGFERMGVRVNLDNQVNDWLKLGVNLSLTKIVRKN
jgi:hypothetical protein